MKFIKKRQLNQRISEIAYPRNVILGRKLRAGTLHPFFLTIPIYLGTFFNGVFEDPKTNDIFEVLSKSDSHTILQVLQLLIFWHFWFADSTFDFHLLSNSAVRQDLDDIWSIKPSVLQALMDNFAKTSPNEDLIMLWGLITSEMGRDDLLPIFIYAHLANAQNAAINEENYK